MLSSSVRSLFLATTLFVLCACSFPGVYKLDVQQGNIVSQDRVDQLKPGMSKRQVRFLMGTPLLVDSFNENRWDYFYSLKNNDDAYSKERLTMFFVDDQLHHMQGNFRPGTGSAVTASADGIIGQQRVPLKNPDVFNRPVIPGPDAPVEVYPVPETQVQEIETPPSAEQPAQ